MGGFSSINKMLLNRELDMHTEILGVTTERTETKWITSKLVEGGKWREKKRNPGFVYNNGINPPNENKQK